MRHTMIIISLLSLGLSGELTGQTVAGDLLGQRIRVQNAEVLLTPDRMHYSNAPRVGTLIQVSGDTLVVALEGGDETLRMVLQETSNLERMARVSAATRGVLIGALVGGSLGASVSLLTFKEEPGQVCINGPFGEGALFGATDCPSRGAVTAGGFLLGGLLGLALGRVIGQSYLIDGWVPVQREELQIEFEVVPTLRGWGPSVRLRF